jgi:hypothetical protein
MEHWEDKDFLDEGAAQDGLAKSEIIIKASSKSKNSSFLDWLNNIFE